MDTQYTTCDSSNCVSCYSNALGHRTHPFKQPSLIDAVNRPWSSDTHLSSLPHRTDVERPKTAACSAESEGSSPSRGINGGLDDTWDIAGSAAQQAALQQPSAAVSGEHSHFPAPSHHTHPSPFYNVPHSGTICLPGWHTSMYGGLLPWQYLPSYQQRLHAIPSALTSLVSFQAPAPRGRRDLVCAVEFSDSGVLLAAGTVGKQVQLYGVREACECTSGVGPPTAPLISHRMPSKLSCLAWTPASDALLTTGDYDGVIYQLDVNTGHFVADIDEHSGKRVLAVAHSRANPLLAASASEDGTVRLWQGPTLSQASVSTITTPSTNGHRPPACSMDFAQDDANLMVVGSADSSAYIYDLRRMDVPLLALRSHARAVSYVRFMHSRSVITAAVDGTLAAWDLASTPAHSDGLLCIRNPYKHFEGHTNSKNFVGLSVDPTSQLMACGSEDGQLFTYCTAWSQPLATYPVSQGLLGPPLQGPSVYGKAGSTVSTTSSSIGSMLRVESCPKLSEIGTSNIGAQVLQGPGGPCTGPYEPSRSGYAISAYGSSQSLWDLRTVQSDRNSSPEFVSAVCWRPQGPGGPLRAPLLAAGTSHGTVSLLQLGLVAA